MRTSAALTCDPDGMGKERVEVYRDAAGEFRWRRIAGNGEPVSESGEGYVNHEWALGQAEALNDGVEVVDLTSN